MKHFLLKIFNILPLHDITTNVADPPEFTAALKNRSRSMNSLQYAGKSIADMQRLAYPDLKPIRITKAPEQVFDLAKNVVVTLGWKILAESKSLLCIEAIDTTRIFRFKDDIIIRIKADENGSILDIRSVSRFGTSDFGANAKRTRHFIQAFHNEL